MISDVATTGNSGSGVFDAGNKCLLGIMSRKILRGQTVEMPKARKKISPNILYRHRKFAPSYQLTIAFNRRWTCFEVSCSRKRTGATFMFTVYAKLKERAQSLWRLWLLCNPRTARSLLRPRVGWLRSLCLCCC